MTWSVDNIITEIKDVGELLHFKKQNGAKNMEQIESTLLGNVTYKLDTMCLSPTDALQIQKALHDDPNLTSDMKGIVNVAIDGSLTREKGREDYSHTYKPQRINVPQYLTMSDWDTIKNSQNYHTKVTTVCRRLRSLGVRSLAEQSVKSAVGAILSGYQDLPDQATMYQMVQDIKLGFASIPDQANGLCFVVKYPDDPTKLSPQLYAHCYSTEHPAQIIPDKLPMILKLIPLRHTHASLAKAKPVHAAPSAGSAASSSPTSSHMAMAPFMEIATSLAAIVKDLSRKPSADDINLTMNHNFQNGQTGPSPAEIESFKPKLRTSTVDAPQVQPAAASVAAPLALENGNGQTDEPGNVHSGNSLDGASIEQAAYDALLARNGSKTKGEGTGKGNVKAQKAKASAKPKPKAHAKGKAKAKACLKRPASAMMPFVYDPGHPGAEWAKRTLESWSSKHYHSSRQMALNQGFTDDEARSFARDARKRSIANWHNTFTS